MARNKDLPRKIRLMKHKKKSGNIPTWVTMKTKGKVRWTPFSRRNWRTQRLKS
ncbi:MAG: 50S ribosomal protein L39e [Candidatus Lokiarchaeota archaeon]|nr:50S ribosomal protein L39e [Candidatus Harpocratesius repetitus]